MNDNNINIKLKTIHATVKSFFSVFPPGGYVARPENKIATSVNEQTDVEKLRTRSRGGGYVAHSTAKFAMYF